MSYLLDTNVISELRKPAGRASTNVRDWAATALSLSLVVITRNIADFQPLAVELLNPWDKEPNATSSDPSVRHPVSGQWFARRDPPR